MKLLGRVCGEVLSFCCALRTPLGLTKTPHDSGVLWKQFMMFLEVILVCDSISAHPPARSGSKGFTFVWQVGAVLGLLVYCHITSVIVCVEVRLRLSDQSRAPLFIHLFLVLRAQKPFLRKVEKRREENENG